MKRRTWKKIVMLFSCIVVFATTYMLILPAISLERSAAEEQAGLDLSCETVEADLIEAGDQPEYEGDRPEYEGDQPEYEGDQSEFEEEQSGLKTTDSDQSTVDQLITDADNSEEDIPELTVGTGDATTFLTGLQTVYGSDFTVTVDVRESAQIPTEAVLAADEITDVTYTICYAQTLEALGVESVPFARFFDIRFEMETEDGVVRVQPQDAVTVTIDTGDEATENETPYALSYGGTQGPDDVAAILNDILTMEEIDGILTDGLTVSELAAVFTERMSIEQMAALLAERLTPEEVGTIAAGYSSTGNDPELDPEMTDEQEAELLCSLLTAEETARILADRIYPGPPTAASMDGVGTDLVLDHVILSVIGSVYTEDYYRNVDGNIYDFSLAGGDTVSLTALMGLLGITEYAGDDDIVSAVSSDQDLVWVDRASEDTTIGELKTANSLDIQYDEDLTDDQILGINARTVSAGEWILIIAHPFAGEQILTVTLKNGAAFSVRVTDGRIRESVKTVSGGTFDISITYGEEAGIPENATVCVGELRESDENYSIYAEGSAEAVHRSSESLKYVEIVDIGIESDGQMIEPSAAVSVTITYHEPVDIPVSQSIRIVHFGYSGTEVIEPTISRDAEGRVMELSFETDSFSYFSIVSQESPADLTEGSYALVTLGNAALLGQPLSNNANRLAGVSVNPTVGNIVQVNGTITTWQFEAVEGTDNWYYVSDGNGNYLNIDTSNDKNLTLGEKQAIYVARRTNGDNTEYQLRSAEEGGLAVNNYGNRAANGFAGWTAGSDNNEWFRLYDIENLGDIRVFFNKNGGTGDAPDTMYGVAGNTITLPDYTGTRDGYTFLGWSTGKNLVNSIYYPLYPAGSQYTVPDKDVTLYAVWTSETPATAEFYIRLDGTIPYEPDQYDSSAYTGKISIEGAVQSQIWVTDNDATKPDNGVNVINNVTAGLNNVPDVDQLVANINASYSKLGFKVANQNGEIVVTEITTASTNSKNYNVSVGNALYVLWYVQKYAGGWHVDGALLVKDRVKISYDGNTLDGSAKNIPLGYQTQSGTEVTIGASGSVSGTVKTPTRAGYQFLGWNLKADGSGDWYYNNDTYTLNEDTTFYAQWSKGTNLMTVYKADEDGQALAGAKFKLEEKTASNTYIEKANRTTGESGIFTYDTMENDTLYRMTETYAPNGYEVQNSFYFKVGVESADSTELKPFLCDAEGNYLNKADYPDWLVITYDPADDPKSSGVARIRFNIKDERIQRKITFVKTDESGEPLADAFYTLTDADEEAVDGILLDKSGNDGVFSVTDATLPYGTYTLTETTPPDGYKTAEPVTFTLNDYVSETENGVTITGGKATSACTVTSETVEGLTVTTYAYTVTVADEKIDDVPIILKKVGYRNTDETSWNLAGATFRIYSDENKQNPVIPDGKTEFTSDADGLLYEGRFTQGTYYLDETVVPSGYNSPEGMYVLTVTGSGVTLNSTATIGSENLNAWISLEVDANTGETVYTVSIRNVTGVQLPETGGPGTWPVRILGFMLAAAAWLVLICR